MYYLAFGINLFLAILEKNLNNKGRKKIFILSFLFMSFFLAGAYNIGADWLNYYYNYSYIPNVFENNEIIVPDWIDFEIGFQYYTSILKYLLSFDGYLVVSKIIDLFIIYLFSKKYTRYTCIFIFIYFGMNLYALEIEAMRQIKAILIFIYSIRFLEKNSFIKYSLCIFLASLFHKTIIVLIFIYFFRNLKISLKNIWGYIFITIILSFFLINILEIAILKISFFNKYTVYLEGYYSSKRSFGLFNIVRNMLFIFPYLCFLYYEDKLSKKIEKYLIIKLLCFIYLIFFILSNFVVIFERFVLYFGFFYFIAWTYIFYLEKNKKIKVFMFIFYTLISLRQTVMLSNALLIKNYQNIFLDLLLQKKISLKARIENNTIYELGKIHKEKLKEK